MAGGTNPYQYAENVLAWSDPLGLAKVNQYLGSTGAIVGDNIPNGQVAGQSTKGGGSGITNSIVQSLYDSVPKAQRSKFHGKCVEADYLSKIANQENVQSVEELKDITKDAESFVYDNKGDSQCACSSCAHVLDILEVKHT